MMKLVTKLTVALVATAALAVPASAQSMYEGIGAVEDGEAGYQLGVAVYNTLNPDTPIPVTHDGGYIFNQTMQNLGAGQGLGDAWFDALQSATDFGVCCDEPR